MSQTDRFVHDRLPEAHQLSHMVYELPGLQAAADGNLVDVLLGKIAERG